MKEIFLCVFGFIVLMISLWGGSWLMNEFPYGSEYNFAAFITSLIVFCAGCGLIGIGANRILKAKAYRLNNAAGVGGRKLDDSISVRNIDLLHFC
jgi:hypothetical protein